MYEDLRLCMRYYNCKLCPRNAKCEREYNKRNKPQKPTEPKPSNILWDGKRR